MNYFSIIAIVAWVVLIPLSICSGIVVTNIEWSAGDKLPRAWNGRTGIKELKKYRETVTDKEELKRLELGITLFNIIRFLVCCFVLAGLAAVIWPSTK
ncbi:hypothetical protein CLV59_101456 [Chitinophaga dinghuensis]|uniref:Uncharacterized protein n=1 Tax=Chitinophaga dinghuensis TaxID=1539050 RepID=A0A327WAX7_9BACT|nr:hypothetical protein [Chitinophaga dinghuensis]RAJ87695.1 hypothetical protein CLV59_101456 [Chitinophaga dinghuensis]